MSHVYSLDRATSVKYYYKVLLQIIIFVVVAFGGLILYDGVTDPERIGLLAAGVFSVWGILYPIPLTILFINHKKHSNGVVFSFDQSNNMVIYKSKDHKLSIPVKDLIKVELFLSPASYTNFIDWQYFGIYHYASLFTKDDGVIKISCLVCDEIEDIFPRDVIHRKKRYMPIIWTSNKNTIK